MLNAATIMVKNGTSPCTFAARRRGAAKSVGRAYLKGALPPGALD